MLLEGQLFLLSFSWETSVSSLIFWSWFFSDAHFFFCHSPFFCCSFFSCVLFFCCPIFFAATQFPTFIYCSLFLNSCKKWWAAGKKGCLENKDPKTPETLRLENEGSNPKPSIWLTLGLTKSWFLSLGLAKKWGEKKLKKTEKFEWSVKEKLSCREKWMAKKKVSGRKKRSSEENQD